MKLQQSFFKFMKTLKDTATTEDESKPRNSLEDTEKQINEYLKAEVNLSQSIEDLGVRNVDVVTTTDMEDSTVLEVHKALQDSAKLTQAEELEQLRIHDLIARSEGTYDDAAKKYGYKSGYDVTLGYGKYVNDKTKPLSSMTIKEVYDLQKKMKKNPKNRFYTGRKDRKGNRIYAPSSAVGRYQFVEPTLRGLVKKLGLSDDTVFSPKVQDMLATELLNESGLNKFKQGKIGKEDFITNISKQWASVANPKTGHSYYGQHTETFLDDWNKVLDTVIGGA